MSEIDRARIASLTAREERRFAETHPKSRALFEAARAHYLGGVPLSWMRAWASPFPIFAAEAKGSAIRDVDGNDYADLCLGDTGALMGHAPEQSAAAIARQIGRGITFMLPTEDAVAVGRELASRFGLPRWQIAMTATDANRFAIRFARQITGRPKILVFNGCYHGTLGESMVSLDAGGRLAARAGMIGPAGDPARTTRCVEQNDLAALERELGHKDVAGVLAEPCLTNVGLVAPAPGWHEGLRALTRRFGSLLILDETHTIAAGPGGCTRAWGLEPDMITLGKSIASGVPVAVYGFSAEIAERAEAALDGLGDSGIGVIGSTLSGSALQLCALRATLERVMTEANFAERMIPMARRFAEGVGEIVEARGLAWHAARLGARAEYKFTPTPPANGAQAMAAVDKPLERLFHLYLLNRGVLITPFYNVVLMGPETTAEQVERHNAVFDACIGELTGANRG